MGTLQEINISDLGKRKIIDSNMPGLRGYVNSLEGIDATHVTFTIQPLSRWWQLKYFLFSPLPGEDSHFD